MQYKNDETFSLHKDRTLGPYWKKISYSGRYVLISSKDLQKQGADVILQTRRHESKVTDTKHIRGLYDRFYLEETSCPKFNTPGWILKEPPHPDFVIYCFWPSCKGCYNNCLRCDNTLSCIAYYFLFPQLREWFLNNKENYPLHRNKTINETTGRLVPVETLCSLGWAKRINEFIELPAKYSSLKGGSLIEKDGKMVFCKKTFPPPTSYYMEELFTHEHIYPWKL